MISVYLNSHIQYTYSINSKPRDLLTKISRREEKERKEGKDRGLTSTCETLDEGSWTTSPFVPNRKVYLHTIRTLAPTLDAHVASIGRRMYIHAG